MPRKKFIVIGGGAAGFFCAVNAARLNPLLEVLILEKSAKILSKVKISGGGRCNVTHACFSIAEMVKKYPRGEVFLKKAFHHFFTTDTIAWFRERGVELKTEPDGRMFPVSDSSQSIIDCLVSELNKYKVQLRLNATVTELIKHTSDWTVVLANGEKISAEAVCVSSGGYSKSTQFDWLRKTGHQVEPPVPSLYTFNIPTNSITALMGVVAKEVTVKITGTKHATEGPLLITHWGMSGPAILKLSAWGARTLEQKGWHFNIIVNWYPALNENTLRERMQQLRFEFASSKLINRNPFDLPQRLWQWLLEQSGIREDLRWADLPAKEQNKLIKNICAQEFEVKGKTTFKEEFVTAGGIELNNIDVHTMQSKLVKGLFFAGEVLDVDGITGGFNFQNAWTTGWIAANAVATATSTSGS